MDNIALAIEVAQRDVVFLCVLELLVEVKSLLEAHLRGNSITFDFGFKVDVFRAFKVGFLSRLALWLLTWNNRQVAIFFRRRGLVISALGIFPCWSIVTSSRLIRARIRRWSWGRSAFRAIYVFLNVLLCNRPIGYQRQGRIHALGGDRNRDLTAFCWGGDGSGGTRGRHTPPIAGVVGLSRYGQAHGRGLAGRNRNGSGNSSLYFRRQLGVCHRWEKQGGR